jgi:hypothetical protein
MAWESVTGRSEYDPVAFRSPGCSGLSLGLAVLVILATLFLWPAYIYLRRIVGSLNVLYGFLMLVPLGSLLGLVAGLVGLRSSRRTALWGIALNGLILICVAAAVFLTIR